MFAPEHRACRKESRRCPCNEFGHTAKLNALAALVVQNLRATSLRLTKSPGGATKESIDYNDQRAGMDTLRQI